MLAFSLVFSCFRDVCSEMDFDIMRAKGARRPKSADTARRKSAGSGTAPFCDTHKIQPFNPRAAVFSQRLLCVFIYVEKSRMQFISRQLLPWLLQ